MDWPGWAVDLWLRVAPYAEPLAVWRGYEDELQTLLLYGVGIAIYTAIVFTFYHNISRRDAFHSESKPGWWGKLVHFTESALVFPTMSFVFFAMLAVSLMMLTPERQNVPIMESTLAVLRTAMAVVVSVRMTAVLMSEDMSSELAKLVPMGLLGVALVDYGFLSIPNTVNHLYEAIYLAPVLGRYFLLFILLEAFMQGLRRLGRRYVRWAEGRQERNRYAPLPRKPKGLNMAHLQRVEVKEGPAPAATKKP